MYQYSRIQSSDFNLCQSHAFIVRLKLVVAGKPGSRESTRRVRRLRIRIRAPCFQQRAISIPLQPCAMYRADMYEAKCLSEHSGHFVASHVGSFHFPPPEDRRPRGNICKGGRVFHLNNSTPLINFRQLNAMCGRSDLRNCSVASSDKST